MKTIRDLVNLLLSHPNQYAELNLILNITNPDADEYDITEGLSMEVWEKDTWTETTANLDIRIFKEKIPIDKENCISNFLDTNRYNQDKLKIEIDAVRGTIYILDKNGGVMRELEMKTVSDKDLNLPHIIKKLVDII